MLPEVDKEDWEHSEQEDWEPRDLLKPEEEQKDKPTSTPSETEDAKCKRDSRMHQKYKELEEGFTEDLLELESWREHQKYKELEGFTEDLLKLESWLQHQNYEEFDHQVVFFKNT